MNTNGDLPPLAKTLTTTTLTTYRIPPWDLKNAHLLRCTYKNIPANAKPGNPHTTTRNLPRDRKLGSNAENSHTQIRNSVRLPFNLTLGPTLLLTDTPFLNTGPHQSRTMLLLTITSATCLLIWTREAKAWQLILLPSETTPLFDAASTFL